MKYKVELGVSITAAVIAIAAVITFTVLIIRYIRPRSNKIFGTSAAAPAIASNPNKSIQSTGDGRVVALVWSQHCKHCKKLKPIFEQLAKAGLPVTTMDGGSKPMSWFVQNRVVRYPTVCVLERGWDKTDQPIVLQQYPPNGARTASSIIDFGKAVGVF